MPNFLYILSDQHNRSVLGCYGNKGADTPNIDRLAERGTRFANAYTNCPICVPVRASLATGRYVHQIRYWDNAHPYDGGIPSWHQRLREQGFRVDSIGKLHFSGPRDDHGLTEEIEPLHVVEGVGDILGCLRETGPFRKKRGGILEAGPGDSTYLRYDRRNADSAIAWLDAHRNDRRPWALFLSFVCPHPPYISPPDDFARYEGCDLPMPPQWRQEEWPDHPAIDRFRRFFDFHSQFTEAEIRRLLASYYATCAYLDRQIGRVLDRVEALGLAEDTVVVYTSDHGEGLGARGIYGKFSLYDESAAVPMVLAGPGIPPGKVCRTPVSLVDTFPTAVETVGARFADADADLPGRSLVRIAAEPDGDRTVFSEYHAVGSLRASYMLRNLRYKYNHYVDGPPQLFDMLNDPDERHDLASGPGNADLLRDGELRLRAIVDPDAADARARADQRKKVDAFGGEAAVLARGAFDNSPVPGEAPAFRKH